MDRSIVLEIFRSVNPQGLSQVSIQALFSQSACYKWWFFHDHRDAYVDAFEKWNRHISCHYTNDLTAPEVTLFPCLTLSAGDGSVFPEELLSQIAVW